MSLILTSLVIKGVVCCQSLDGIVWNTRMRRSMWLPLLSSMCSAVTEWKSLSCTCTFKPIKNPFTHKRGGEFSIYWEKSNWGNQVSLIPQPRLQKPGSLLTWCVGIQLNPTVTFHLCACYSVQVWLIFNCSGHVMTSDTATITKNCFEHLLRLENDM